MCVASTPKTCPFERTETVIRYSRRGWKVEVSSARFIRTDRDGPPQFGAWISDDTRTIYCYATAATQHDALALALVQFEQHKHCTEKNLDIVKRLVEKAQNAVSVEV